MKKFIFPLLAIFLAIDAVVFFSAHGGRNFVNADDSNIANHVETGADIAAGSVQPANAQNIDITNFSFNPQRVTITPGTAVTWTNHDNVTHTATADDGTTFNSGDIAPGQSFSFTFDQPGTFTYHCEHHPEMTGAIVVSAPATNDQTNEPGAITPSDNTTATPEDTTPATTLETAPATTPAPATQQSTPAVNPHGTTSVGGSGQSQQQSESQSIQLPAGTTTTGFSVVMTQSQQQQQSQ